MKLNKILPLISVFQGMDKDNPLSALNVDDYFFTLNELGVEEVTVNQEQMNIIVRFYLGNVGNDKNGDQAKVIKETKLDCFLGVKLILEE